MVFDPAGPHFYAYDNDLFTLLQHVQENLNLTGGRKAGEAQAQAAAQVQAAPAQGVAARLIAALEDEDDD